MNERVLDKISEKDITDFFAEFEIKPKEQRFKEKQSDNDEEDWPIGQFRYYGRTFVSGSSQTNVNIMENVNG